ncbi:putative membrane protein [Handroanthus impetiginosus]|uniref:Post-GPI attachment to proteins factor 3 n=1 Tax=Handroanthus impetiginosus TaxID=429701 RepID=A0A2G9GJ27_9LAMI|nr:putative membrane protein [Handroanthus impetiginosus]
MTNHYWIICSMVFSCLVRVYEASAGDSDLLYRACVKQCEKTGCAGERCFSHCKFTSDGSSLDGPWYMQEPLYLWWKQSTCQSDCRYHCMLEREKERAEHGQASVKYHGKWPIRRLCGFQEPASAAFSALNLAMHFHGLWNIYGLLSMNAWFWSAVFHSRDVDLTERLDYSSAVALLGYSLVLAIIRSFGLRNDAAGVMVAAPIIAFTTTHILFLNNYEMDYGWNMKVRIAMGIAQLLTWSIWGAVTHHPSRWKLWIASVGGSLAMLLEIYDFPPYEGMIDAHALWHASAVPLTCVWWSFIKDDAEYRTSNILKKVR